MEKPGAREGQESTGDIGYKRGTKDNCMMTSFVHLTVSTVLHFLTAVFFLKFAISIFKTQWD